jgi:subtilisin family serine protease
MLLFREIASNFNKMAKAILSFILVSLICTFSTNGQMNLAMRNRIASGENMNYEMYILVKGDVQNIREFVNSHNGTFIHSAGDIASVRLTVSAIAELATQPFVKVIGSDIHSYKTLNDTMRMRTHVDDVHSGLSPLTQSYKGQGVLLGFIDSGIDVTHPDFVDSTGHSRIKWIWDMNMPSGPNTPAPYNYGQEFTGQQIDTGTYTSHCDTNINGHGTCVAGIAAGNGRAVGHLQGVATESDIIFVAYNFANDTISHLSHAVEYIFTKAQQMGRPVVINVSIGDYFGSHDGLDLESQYISYLIFQHPGRVIVSGSGDIGTQIISGQYFTYHLGRTLNGTDTMFTWNKYNAAYPGVYFQLFADTADFNNVKFSIGADQVTPNFNFRGQTAFTYVFPSINNVVNQNLMNGGNRIGRIQTYTSLDGGVYSIEVYIIPDSISYYWRLTTTGTGRFDSWSYDYFITGLPSVATYPQMSHYWPADTISSMVTGIACLDNVITVGNYDNTDSHLDADTILRFDATNFPGRLATNSGRGPTRDGRIKPEICAPGNHIVTSGALALLPSFPRTKLAPGAMHTTFGGTSASAPVISGIAALYLQQNPGANWQDVKVAILNCAIQDSLMWGPYPNNSWGFGKVNAFEALTTCSMSVSVPETRREDGLKVFPNPVATKLNVQLDGAAVNNLRIFDMTGRIVYANIFSENVTIDLDGFNEGMYILRIESSDGKLISSKFAVSH